MITIVNYGSGNIKAITNIFEKYNIAYRVATHFDELASAQKIILPGVGAFDATMEKLEQSGLRLILDKKALVEKIPVLGICVGMQIMGEGSDEGKKSGLGWISGRVKKFDSNQINHLPKTPHLGWNSIQPMKAHKLLEGIDKEKGFYFIHNYYFEASNESDVLTTTHYGYSFASALQKDNIMATQFHPEKSHINGVQLLINFSKL